MSVSSREIGTLIVVVLKAVCVSIQAIYLQGLTELAEKPAQ